MKFRDVLVHVTGYEFGDDGSETEAASALEGAITVAKFGQGQVTGVHVVDIPPLPGYALAYIPPDVLEARREGYDERAEATRAAFGARLEAAGVTGEFVRAEGEPARCVERLGRYAELVVMLSDPERHTAVPGDAVAAEVVLHCGRPVLMMPVGSRLPEPTSLHALVAWDGSREAARAINDARPLLAAARRVEVVSIHARDTERAHGMAREACRHLARAGIEAEPRALQKEHGTGATLIAHAEQENVDLIVMGAYGHSRMAEIVLGGVTEEILRKGKRPALVSH